MRVKSPVAGCAAVAIAVLGCLMFSPGDAFAGIGGGTPPTMISNVTVGDSGLLGSVKLINNNDGGNSNTPNTVCQSGDASPCPAGDPGIVLTPSCGNTGGDGDCDPTKYDPDVYQLDPTATGAAGTACANVTFSVVKTDAARGRYTFTPNNQPGNFRIVLGGPTNGAIPTSCTINFTYKVLKMPKYDYLGNPADGIQTVPISQVSQVGDGTWAFARGTTKPVTISKATPTIATTASSTIGVGGQITDMATVSGRVSPVPGATVTFNLYGPNDATCTGPVAATSTIPVNEPTGTATSAAFATSKAGDYRWVAIYSGDANNAAVTGPCNAPNELTTVTKAPPTISTLASGTVTLGGQISDTATVSGRSNAIAVPPATVAFKLYGPNDATCTGAVIFSSTIALSEPAGTANSGGFVPTTVGDYRWIATYSGDANNASVSGACNDAGEKVTVSPPGPNTPAIVTTASQSVRVGNPITDSAVVSGRVNPVAGATVAFNLYGPDDATCATAAIFSSTVPLLSNGTAISAAFVPTLPGTYRWTAAYSGDANNNAVTDGCNGPNEAVLVTDSSSSPPVTPNITTKAGGTLLIGGLISDQATVTNRVNALAGSTVTFSLYGPNDATCATAPIFTSTIGLDASGNATSGTFAPTAAGVYRWIAHYSGDANNNPVSGPCGESSETVTIVASQPTLITVASVNTALGGLVGDTAQVSGLVNPVAGATVTFNLYGPDDTTCSRPPVFTSTVALGSDATAKSATYAPTAVGTYRWIAGYSGDANNSAVVAACNAANEAVALLGPDFQQSLPATGSKTTLPITLGSLLIIGGGLVLFSVRRRSNGLRN